MKLAFAFLLAVAATLGYGQNVLEVPMHGQPLIYTDAGKVTGCGMRVVGVDSPSTSAAEFKSFDVSVNIDSRPVGFGKVIGELNSVADPRKSRRQSLHGVWLRAKHDDPVAPIGDGLRPSPADKGAYLFQAPANATMDLIFSMLKGDPLQVGLRWERDREAIYLGRPVLPDDEKRQVMECLDRIFK